jgi:hypothetical protein
MPDGRAREAAVPAVTASAGLVITRRSATCGPACQSGPCTLAQVRVAQRVAVTDPRVTLWAELSVVAHLTGWDMPRPAPAFTASLRSMDARLRECAISHAVDAAVAARVPAISTRISPAALAVHVTGAMHQAIAEGTRACEPEEPQYLAPPYRWALVRDALRPVRRAQGPGRRHPRSGEWERAYGQPVPGATAKAQLTAVTRWYLRDQRDSKAITTVLWGSRPRSAIEQAVGAYATSEDWPSWLSEALDAFTKLSWPRNLLCRASSRVPQARKEPGGADE